MKDQEQEVWPYKGMSVEEAIDAAKWDKHSTWNEIINERTGAQNGKV